MIKELRQGFGEVVLWDILPIKTENFVDVTKMAEISMDGPNVKILLKRY